MATWKKLVVSGSDISQLNNDAGYLTSITAQHAFTTASFNGTPLLADSSQGTLNFASGSTGLNIVATAGTDTLTFDLVAIPNTSLANDSITVGTTEIDLGTSSTTLAGLTSVASTSITGSLLGNVIGNVTGNLTGTVTATSVLADGVIATTQSPGDNSTKVATTEYVDSQVGTATLTIDSGNDASQIAIDLNDENLSVTGNDGLTVNNAGNDVGIGLDDGGILPVKLDSTLAGDGLTSTAGVLSLTNDTISGISLGSDLADLTVDDSSLELSAGTTYNGGTAKSINVKALGITNAMLAGNIANAKLVNDSITIGAHEVNLGESVTLEETKFNSGSFSGSFEGDGSGLTGIATTLNLTDGSNPQAIDLQTETLTFAGTTNEIEVSTATTDTVTIGLPDDVTIGQDLTVTRDLTVSRNLTVLGTASFQHTEDLDVADRFIRLASGSTAAGDGGIVIQQTGALDGEVFGFDSAETRFGISGSFDASQNVFTPDAFMAAVINTNGNDPNNVDAPDARYNKKGNLYVAGDSEDIWIYS